MIHLKRNILWLFLSLITVSALAQQEAVADSLTADSLTTDTVCAKPWKETVREKLQRRMADRLFETAQLGFMVWDLTEDSLLFVHGERQRLRPASTMKVVTAIGALDHMGADKQFATRLYLTGAQRDSTRTWDGRLYIVGGMDPYLKQEDFHVMADSLKALGIDTIAGGLYSDYSFKDTKRMGAGWCWDDENPSLVPLTYKGRDDVASQLRQALQSRGIIIDGGSYDGERPSDARVVCTRQRQLTTVMRPMMKDSNNKCAESVFYLLAHEEGGKGASAKSAARAIAKTERKAGLQPDRYHVADGSGLSLYNYVSAEMEVRLLRYAYQKREIYDALYPLLPVAGIDGTLKKRMHGTAARGNVHAKTGTVTGVRSLAGYCTARNGHVLAFAMLVQGIDDGSAARSWQDRVCADLCE